MRRIIIPILFVAVVTLSYAFAQHHLNGHKERHILYYTDPMHPAYKSDKPGIAPDCGMELVAVYGDEARDSLHPAHSDLPASDLHIDAASQKLAGIRLASVVRTTTARTIHAVGRVVPDETRVYKLNAGVDGFIRETYRDSVGTIVTKDQRLAAFYAPEFLSAASGFLAANERIPGSVTNEGARSIQNYTDRLRNLGMSDPQIRHITETRRLPDTIDIVAPVDGVILARNISPDQHFEHGMEFYRIADLRQVWVVAELDRQDQLFVRGGEPAQITLRDEGRHFPARISDSLPQSDLAGGTVKVRLELKNPKLILRPEMTVDVEMSIRQRPAIVVPTDALIDSGTHTRVYVEHGVGVFERRDVETGWRTDEAVEILSGVQPGDRVVVASTFLVDSESRLRTAAQFATRGPDTN